MAAKKLAFTLVELMVVIGIIGVLLGMLLPALNTARVQARVAATRATLSVLDTGIETFRTDTSVGGAYPPSWAVRCEDPRLEDVRLSDPVQGAALLAWALVGADMLGTPGFKNIDGVADSGLPSGLSDVGGWTSDTSSKSTAGAGDLYAIDQTTRQPVHTRKGPFVELSRVKLPERDAAANPPTYRLGVGSKAALPWICFLDAFDRPILYYRANRGAAQMASNTYATPAVYNLMDNALFTGNGGPGLDLGAGNIHPLGQLGGYSGNEPAPRGSFLRYVWDRKITARPTPQRADSYILISAGRDGLYGTSDDVTNGLEWND